ncbi:GAF and ANTAR domain-containing protein [Parafrankia sp. FMc6]|uniref:GAF and ANTAR domain-containing protein n=1 Tax=Parafrankia soli TaxID=2599596 RepID=UPI0034D6FBE5
MSVEQDFRTALGSLSGLLMTSQPLETTLTRVAGFAVTAIPGADGVGLTLIEAGQPDTIVASTNFVRVVDEVQYRLREGPCLQAVADRRTQICGSLGGESRWPRFGPRAGRLGVHSALSLPLLVTDRVVGALNVYAHEQDAFTASAVRLGELFSEPAAVAVANAQVLAQTQRLAAQLESALTNRATIDQAIGIVMSRSGASAQEAFDVLRERSQRDHVKLADVARRLVEDAMRRARHRR